MSSLNGDMFVMRNGRSTSEVSVYNYPEHLNPFYEDDQHKRLRFWHINKKGDDGTRRNSFSISNLKDIWAFKSFRLKKKSSTLGVNKTSESPPPLRRDIYYGASPINNGNSTNFPRNVLYRSSLQNMNAAKDNSNELGFYRNNRYRQTIQNVGGTTSSPSQQTLTSHRRYVYGGSVTPQPLRSSDYDKGDENHGIMRGSSQLSVSTNPFDSDNDDADNDNEVVSISNRHSTHAKKIQRKKRKAPAPPVPIHRINQNNELKESNQTELHIDESLHIEEEEIDIANLTAEIESFVKSTNEESTERRKTINQPAISKENGIEFGKLSNEVENFSKVESTEKITQTKPKVSKNTKSDETYEHAKYSQNNFNNSGGHEIVIKDTNKEIPEKVPRHNETIDKCHKQESGLRNTSPPPVYVQEPETGHVECIHVHIDSPKSLRNYNETNKLSSFHTSQKDVKETVTQKSAFTLTNPPKAKQIEIELTTGATNSMIRSSVTPPTSTANNLESFEENNNNNSTHIMVRPPIATKPVTAPKSKPITPVQVHKSKNVALTDEFKGNVVSINKKESLEVDKTDVSSNFQTTKESLTTQVAKIESEPEPLKIVELAQNDLKPELAATNANNIVNGGINKMDLYADLYREPSSRFEWKNSTLAPLEPNVPPEKRKSVKEIIESINKSQRLLNAAAHREQAYSSTSMSQLPTASTPDTITTPTNTWKYAESNNLNQNKEKLDVEESEYQHTNTNGKIVKTATSTTNATNIKDNSQKLDNDEIFKKCRVNKEVYDCRESSPTASNLDWNPVPKPKRTKNLSDV